MPILDVTLVVGADETLSPGLAQRVADAAGRHYDAAPGTVWVTLHTVAADHYAENDSAATATPRPVFVRITQAAAVTSAERAAEALALTHALAAALGRDPALVHLLFEPPAAGRIAFGGTLRT